MCVCKQDSPDLLLLLRMLSLGQGAWDMIDSQVFKEPRLVRTLLKTSMFLLVLGVMLLVFSHCSDIWHWYKGNKLNVSSVICFFFMSA